MQTLAANDESCKIITTNQDSGTKKEAAKENEPMTKAVKIMTNQGTGGKKWWMNRMSQ
jgi:hypothetical protein